MPRDKETRATSCEGCRATNTKRGCEEDRDTGRYVPFRNTLKLSCKRCVKVNQPCVYPTTFARPYGSSASTATASAGIARPNNPNLGSFTVIQDAGTSMRRGQQIGGSLRANGLGGSSGVNYAYTTQSNNSSTLLLPGNNLLVPTNAPTNPSPGILPVTRSPNQYVSVQASGSSQNSHNRVYSPQDRLFAPMTGTRLPLTSGSSNSFPNWSGNPPPATQSLATLAGSWCILPSQHELFKAFSQSPQGRSTSSRDINTIIDLSEETARAWLKVVTLWYTLHGQPNEETCSIYDGTASVLHFLSNIHVVDGSSNGVRGVIPPLKSVKVKVPPSFLNNTQLLPPLSVLTSSSAPGSKPLGGPDLRGGFGDEEGGEYTFGGDLPVGRDTSPDTSSESTSSAETVSRSGSNSPAHAPSDGEVGIAQLGVDLEDLRVERSAVEISDEAILTLSHGMIRAALAEFAQSCSIEPPTLTVSESTSFLSKEKMPFVQVDFAYSGRKMRWPDLPEWHNYVRTLLNICTMCTNNQAGKDRSMRALLGRLMSDHLSALDLGGRESYNCWKDFTMCSLALPSRALGQDQLGEQVLEYRINLVSLGIEAILDSPASVEIYVSDLVQSLYDEDDFIGSHTLWALLRRTIARRMTAWTELQQCMTLINSKLKTLTTS